MINEAELRDSFPEIPWDRPVEVHVYLGTKTDRWVCRYCIALYGLKGSKIETTSFAFLEYEEALEHIAKTHHQDSR